MIANKRRETRRITVTSNCGIIFLNSRAWRVFLSFSFIDFAAVKIDGRSRYRGARFQLQIYCSFKARRKWMEMAKQDDIVNVDRVFDVSSSFLRNLYNESERVVVLNKTIKRCL